MVAPPLPPLPPTSGPKEFPRPRILVVEDDEDLLRMMYRLLGSVGDVAMAADGEHALQILQHGDPPDLVVTDLMMPRKDGLSLVKDMKADERLRNVPAIILTAKSGPRDVIAGINSGARHYLTKPFKPDELIAKVKKVLNLR